MNNKNFSQWSKIVKVWFKGQGKYRYLANSTPFDLTELEQWEQQDVILLSFMWDSMEFDTIVCHIILKCTNYKVVGSFDIDVL